jgi:hypothetical protein
MVTITPKNKQGNPTLLPPGLFMPSGEGGGYGHAWGTITSTKAILSMAKGSLGLTHGRLVLILGEKYLTNAYSVGKTVRLSTLKLERLCYLFYLKLLGINTAAIYLIDWKEGVIYFNEGEPLRLTEK